MYILPVNSLSPGMTLYEDVYSNDKILLLKANTRLTQEKIEFLIEKHIDSVPLAEPLEVEQSRYEHLHNNEHFQRFNAIYDDAIASFIKILRNFDTGLDVNLNKLISLRDDVLHSVMDGEQLLDYLYNLMANQNQITYNHCFNCGLLCYVFAKWCDFPESDLDTITLCGFSFDVGKIKISDELLWKQGALTPEELLQMQHHIHLGYDLLKTKKNLPPHVISVLIMHHERCDGSGYPAGIKENRIDPYALLAGIVDTYEAMTHPRAQRIAMTPFQAIEVFEKQGFHKYGEKNLKIILSRIANSYLERRVCLNNGTVCRVTEIHDDMLSKPTVYCNKQYIDLREHPELTITRMN